jgi:hypothetical protein
MVRGTLSLHLHRRRLHRLSGPLTSFASRKNGLSHKGRAEDFLSRRPGHCLKMSLMPQYNGPASYLVEVLEHLLRHYVVWLFVYAVVLPAPFVIWGALTVGLQHSLLTWLSLSVGWPVWWFSVSHLVAFAALPYYVDARFPYASPYLTFAIAGLAGASLLATFWTISGGVWMGDTFLDRFQWAGLATIAAAAFGAALLKIGGTGALHFGSSRWMGWLVVGYSAFEAFLAKDAERLKREYEEFAKPVRR